MRFISKLFGKGKAALKHENAGVNLAFVLLSEPRMPSAQEIMHAYQDYAAPGESLLVDADGGKATSSEIISLELSSGETVFVALMPVAVPNGEADHGAQFSLSSFVDGWKLPPHCAHLLVTLMNEGKASPVVRLSRFTSVVAAVTKSSPAVGVYWGNAGATHGTEFFLSVASEHEIASKIILWSGVSVAQEKDGRLSLLSWGMEQLNLPDLLLVAGEASAGSAMEMMYDLLAYVVERGEALPEGNTVGRTAEERLPVHYVRSPVDSSKKVWRVEFP